MTNFDELLNSFQSQKTAQQDSVIDFFSPETEQREPTPEERDLERLEEDIREIFGARRLFNNVLAGLLGVIGSSAGIHLFARLGIPAIASSTLGGVVVALAFGNALTSIRIEQGRPHIDGEFFLNLAQALGITGAMWVGAQEYRQLESLATSGKSEFLTEVKNFEVMPQPPNFAGMGMVGIGVALLIVAVAVLKGKRNDY
jgi:hypothetical protein